MHTDGARANDAAARNDRTGLALQDLQAPRGPDKAQRNPGDCSSVDCAAVNPGYEGLFRITLRSIRATLEAEAQSKLKPGVRV